MLSGANQLQFSAIDFNCLSPKFFWRCGVIWSDFICFPVRRMNKQFVL